MADKHELRDKGLRLTPQRELVLSAVRELGHATPEEVAEKDNIAIRPKKRDLGEIWIFMNELKLF